MTDKTGGAGDAGIGSPESNQLTGQNGPIPAGKSAFTISRGVLTETKSRQYEYLLSACLVERKERNQVATSH